MNNAVLYTILSKSTCTVYYAIFEHLSKTFLKYVAASEPEHELEEYSGFVGNDELIESPGFRYSSYESNKIYIYTFVASNGYVRITFTDFYLHENSILRVST